ncbi:hypothetical protein N657DRAFT_576854 [Parathielavia appendiculata]|uniref:Uncharacterized protein n=1 Tax=Parathielavia appendiculata TaxID=2587402 RepID=A0AAN6TXR8_9PEZI|nr:hypothetical protein N657DRAFT_576854 [Parathielavia appendiculata]
MSVNPGTLRGTPNRGQSRGAIPFANTPTSGIPRPVLEATPSTTSEAGPSSTVSASRQKQSKRDEAIRRKMENDLSKKKHLTSRARQSRKAPPGTVLALKPSQALQIKPQTSVAEAAQLMAAKREDCVLVTDDDDRIAGIFTAKDLAFRVVGAGLKPNNVTIAEIMTKNPLCARTDTSATDALDLMVRKGFRHLPVMDENQDISGVLDITKCFYEAMEKLERAYSSSRRLYDALEGVQSELGSSQPQQIIQYVEALRSKMSGPTLESVLNGLPPTTVSVRTSVKEAAQLMKENHTTAVLVQDQGAITGIFTSKDVVLRVIAPGLDPATCSVVRVMTPHPDFAPMDMSIQAALRKMHDGHYLNLPVMNDGGEIVGMVDVLKLTYATLEQINSMNSNDSEGPAWNKFWLSLDHETESMVSGDGSHHHTNANARSLMSPDISRSERLPTDSVLPGDSASHTGVESPPHSAVGATPEVPPAETPFPFKFKAPSGRVHRLQVTAAHGMAEFVANVTAKLGSEVDAIGGAPTVEDGKLSGGYALSYLDDEGDSVSITTDQDLLEAIVLARQGRREKVDLFVHDPKEPPVAPALAPAPAPEPLVVPTPPLSSVVRERRKPVGNDEDEEDGDVSEGDETPVRTSRHPRTRTAPQPEQVIAGVPNELLLPGAIAMLAVVIVGVFTISRMSSRGWQHCNAMTPTPTFSTMILRSFGVRHGRRALAAPISRLCLRTISSSATRPATAPTTFAEPTAMPTTATPTNVQSYHAAKTAARKAELAQIPAIYLEYQHQREHTRSIGARVESRYHPDQMLLDPPHDATLEMLMAAQCHMGHHVSQWNPANQRYIYGERAGIHIISLETTAAHLRRAARVVEEVAYYGGLILFVGNRKEHRPIVVRAAELAKGCHLFQQWTPGAITNRDVILASGQLKMVDERDAELQGFDMHLRDCRPVVPDLVVCLNPLENYPLLHECGLANIPTIGVIDTDADPTWVTYQIPANDDSVRSVTLIAGVLGRAGERGQQRRLADANDGICTWENARDIEIFIRKDAEAKAQEEYKAAAAEGVLDKKVMTREDFLTDDELLKEMVDGPITSSAA